MSCQILQGPLPIKYLDLATAAEEMRAYAKALRYTELQILQKPEADLSVDDLQVDLIKVFIFK